MQTDVCTLRHITHGFPCTHDDACVSSLPLPGPVLQERMKAVCSQLNLVEDEMYDLVLMRNEYKVKLGMHTGRVPADLADIFDELAAA